MSAICPRCGAHNLTQQLNKVFFNCLECGRWFKLSELKEDATVEEQPHISEAPNG